MTETEKESNYLSPSRLIKWLFPDKYKEIPEWVLERAAEQGKDLHELIEAYINGADVKDIEELIFSEKDKRAFNAVKNWYDNLKKPKLTIDMKSEFYIKNDEAKLHGYLDLVDFENKIFYDFKFRNLKDELDLTTDIIQMLFYKMVIQKSAFDQWKWKLIYIDKQTGELKEYTSDELVEKENEKWTQYSNILINGIKLYKKLEETEHKLWNKKKTLKI